MKKKRKKIKKWAALLILILEALKLLKELLS
nr:MAG TPA_asm: hypothetical protein [Caudoviricetes sp.]